MQTAIQLTTALTALVAVIVGPIVALHVAKRQIKATVLSSNRQAWINTLRESLSAFVSYAFQFRTIVLTTNVFTPDELKTALNGAIEATYRVKLLLNADEPWNQKLMANMDKILAICCSEHMRDDVPTYEECEKQVLWLSRFILKSEWQRVKRGE